MKKLSIKRNTFWHYFERAFIALFVAASIQVIVLVLWGYLLVTNHTFDELSVLSLREWHQGVETAWHDSLGLTKDILFFIFCYFSIHYFIERWALLNRLFKCLTKNSLGHAFSVGDSAREKEITKDNKDNKQ